MKRIARHEARAIAGAGLTNKCGTAMIGNKAAIAAVGTALTKN